MQRRGTLLFGMALGAGMVYLLDPHSGARRRSLLRDKLVHARHELGDTAATSARRARNRAVGLAHEAKAELTERHVDDTVLVERVRSAMGRTVSSPGAVQVTAVDGRVTLTGLVPSAEVQELVRTVKSVRGVDSVDNRLEVQADTASLQG
jgi:osmotically-inducible protein OsmY